MKTLNKYKGMILVSLFFLGLTILLSDNLQEQKKDLNHCNETSQINNIEK